MNIAYRTPLTVPEYLAWADAQSERPRTELIDGQIVQMASQLAIHARLTGRAFTALSDALAESGLAGEVFNAGMLVPISATSAFEPDTLLYLGAPISDRQLTVPTPVVIVEVLSPTTAHIDRGVKLTGYFTLPSVAHYLILDPETMSVTRHTRAADGAVVATTHTGGPLILDPPGLTLDLDRIMKR